MQETDIEKKVYEDAISLAGIIRASFLKDRQSAADIELLFCKIYNFAEHWLKRSFELHDSDLFCLEMMNLVEIYVQVIKQNLFSSSYENTVSINVENIDELYAQFARVMKLGQLLPKIDFELVTCITYILTNQ